MLSHVLRFSKPHTMSMNLFNDFLNKNKNLLFDFIIYVLNLHSFHYFIKPDTEKLKHNKISFALRWTVRYVDFNADIYVQYCIYLRTYYFGLS